MKCLVVLVAVVAAACATYPAESALYEDILMQDLYKRLNEMAAEPARPQYLYEDDSYPYGQQNDGWGNSISLESRESGRPGQADLRDHEYLQHSSNSDGFQYISGGAGEGKQHLNPSGTQDNRQEVKSDEGLPFYCHPPNPCPKGFTAEDGCHDFTEDIAEFQQEWILKMQSKQMCACDEEHMFRCPKNEKAQNNVEKQHSNSKYDIDEVINGLLDSDDNPYVNKDDKRELLVAKKSPIVKRSTNAIDEYLDKVLEEKQKRVNPYLDGSHQQLQRVAKKG